MSNGVTTVTEGQLVNCTPSFIVLATTSGNVTILAGRICRVEVICPPV
jgi:F0F1-type ATP synthase epsilon subunit